MEPHGCPTRRPDPAPDCYWRPSPGIFGRLPEVPSSDGRPSDRAEVLLHDA